MKKPIVPAEKKVTKRKPSPKITMDEWINATFNNTLPERPSNSITTEELSKKTGLSYSQVSNILRKMWRDGNATRGKCFIDGRVTTFYIPKEFQT